MRGRVPKPRRAPRRHPSSGGRSRPCSRCGAAGARLNPAFKQHALPVGDLAGIDQYRDPQCLTTLPACRAPRRFRWSHRQVTRIGCTRQTVHRRQVTGAITSPPAPAHARLRASPSYAIVPEVLAAVEFASVPRFLLWRRAPWAAPREPPVRLPPLVGRRLSAQTIDGVSALLREARTPPDASAASSMDVASSLPLGPEGLVYLLARKRSLLPTLPCPHLVWCPNSPGRGARDADSPAPPLTFGLTQAPHSERGGFSPPGPWLRGGAR